jgi:uncharacterized protein (TIRG00374 family)
MRRTILMRWARMAFGLGLLGLLLARVHLGELAALGRQGNPSLLALALLLLLLANPLLQVMRLHVLIERYTIRFITTFKLFCVGAFFNLMLPSSVGGDAVKLVYLRRMNAENWGAPFALLLLHRVSGMVTLLFGAALYVAIDHVRFMSILRAAHVDARMPFDLRVALLALLALLLLGLAWLAVSGRYRNKLSVVLRGFIIECVSAVTRVGTRATLLLLVFTFAFHFVRVWAFYVLVAYAGHYISMLDSLVVLAATAMAGIIPITVGGLGLMEGAVSMTLLLYGVPEHAGIVVALANRAVLLTGAAIGGIINLTFRAAAASVETPHPHAGPAREISHPQTRPERTSDS